MPPVRTIDTFGALVVPPVVPDGASPDVAEPDGDGTPDTGWQAVTSAQPSRARTATQILFRCDMCRTVPGETHTGRPRYGWRGRPADGSYRRVIVTSSTAASIGSGGSTCRRRRRRYRPTSAPG